MGRKPLPPDKSVGKPEIARMTGVTAESVENWLRAGKFPPPDFLLPTGRKRWLATTIKKWLASRAPGKGGAA